VTPGSTAPLGSFTVPVIEAWAYTAVGMSMSAVNITKDFRPLGIGAILP
jgi:hypothetical protein